MLSNLLNTRVVSIKYDIFWEDLPKMMKNVITKPVIFLTSTYNDGSAEEVQLHKMMQACDLSDANSVIIKITDNQEVAWSKLNEYIKSKVIILLEIVPQQLGISALFRLNEPNNFDGHIWIPALSLTEMEQQPDMKAALWRNALKPVFKEKTLGNI